MTISRSLGGAVALLLLSQAQGAYAQTPLPQLSDPSLQLCLNETAARQGWQFAEQVTSLSCVARGVVRIDGVELLVNLEQLNLANNQLLDVFPLGQLGKLVGLNLAGNGRLAVPSLSAAMFNLGNLTALNLNGVNVGPISNLNNLTNPRTGQPLPLVELDLGNTRYRDAQNGNSIEFVRNLPTLKKFGMAGNNLGSNLSNLEPINALPQLEELDLSNNRLEYLGFFAGNSLKRLNLSGNRQLQVQEAARLIAQNPGLIGLNLNGVKVGDVTNLGPLTDPTTGAPLDLQELDLGNTGLKDRGGADADIGFLRVFANLKQLNLANLGLSEVAALSSLQQMQQLDLSGNRLQSAGALGLMRNLTRLNLSGNHNLRFDELSNSVIVFNPGLTSIGLNGINIGLNSHLLTSLRSTPEQLRNMAELDLGNTALDDNGLSILGSFPNLRKLNLAGNRFSELANYEVLLTARNLQELDFSDNALPIGHVLYTLRDLTRLNLSRTGMRGDDVRQIVGQNPNLTSLKLSGIQIGQITNLGGLRNNQTGQMLDLTELDLSYSGLLGNFGGNQGFDFLQQLPNLTHLNLAGNGIRDLYEHVDLRSLVEFDVSHNQLLNLPAPSNPEQLQRVNLSGNPALERQALASWLTRSPALNSIGVNGIKLSSVADLGLLVDPRTGQPLDLIELDLGNTGLVDANGGVDFLAPFVNLQKLSLANNGLKNVNALSGLTKLTELDLSHNALSSLAGLNQRRLTRLDVSGNVNLPGSEVEALVSQNPNLNQIGLNGINLGRFSNLLSQLVAASANGRGIQVLDLGNTRLNPDSLQVLGAIPNLQRLNLSGNNVTAQQLDGIGAALNAVRDLDLSNNPIGEFVAFASQLRNLTRLNLAGTKMRKDDVRQIINQNPALLALNLNGLSLGLASELGALASGQLASLTELDLGNTGLQGSYGTRGFDFLTRLPALARLNLAGNGITDLPELQTLTNLTDLDLSDNQLVGVNISPTLLRLQRLNLSGNRQLPVIEVARVIGHNPGLTRLGLAGLPVGNITNLGPLTDPRNGRPLDLIELDLGNTGLLGPDGQKRLDFLAQYVNLQRLNLAGNGMANIAPLAGLHQLRELDLSNNGVVDISALNSLRNLTRLNLSGNSAIDPLQLRSVLDLQSNLTGLAVNGIALRDFSALGSLFNPQTGQPYKLVELDVGNTQLNAQGNSSPIWLASFPDLQRINLAGNGLTNLAGLEPLTQVSVLDVSNNKLSDLREISALTGLSTLRLSGNTAIPSGQLSNLVRQNPGLTRLGVNGIALNSLDDLNRLGDYIGRPLNWLELDLGNTGLKGNQGSYGYDFLNNSPALTHLNLAGNGITNLPELQTLANLTDLDLSGNQLTNVPISSAATRLQRLNLSGNRQLPVPEVANIIGRNPGLTRLALAGLAVGNITNLGPLYDWRVGRPLDLTELDLANTGLLGPDGQKNLDFLAQFGNLQRLNLAGNGMANIAALAGLNQLRELDLSNNGVADINALNPLRNLTRLNLSGNSGIDAQQLRAVLAVQTNLTSLGANGIVLRDISALGSLLNPQTGLPFKLVELDLGYTQLSAQGNSNPTIWLASFPGLQRLNLAGNGLISLAGLEPLGQISELDVSNNKLLDLREISALTGLSTLRLSGNTAIPGAQLGSLVRQNPGLTRLSVNGLVLNSLDDVNGLNGSNGNALNLLELDLGNTGLQTSLGSYGYSFLTRLPALTHLNLAGNGITQLPELQALGNLTDLDLSGNQLIGVQTSFANTRLQRLNLSGNRQLSMSDVANVIGRSPGLTRLALADLAVGNITNLGPLTDWRNGRPLDLIELDLANTGLLGPDGQKSLDFLVQFGNLQRLNVAGNGMANIAPLTSLSQLRELDLSNNGVVDISALNPLRNLTRLNLSGNSAIDAQQLRAALTVKTNLTSLGANGITLGDISALGSLVNPQTGLPYKLLELDLGNTQLSAQGNSHPTWLAGFPYLQRLNLAGNGLTSLAGLEPLTQISELDVSNNNLSDLREIAARTGLTTLRLSGNTAIPRTLLGNLVRQNSGLTRLAVNGIGLSSLADLNGLNGNNGRPLNLVELDLGNTLAPDLDGLYFLAGFPNLSRLNLAGNNLRNIGGIRVLAQQNKLLDLDLANNALSSPADLYGMFSLQTLNLTGNAALRCFDLDILASGVPTTQITRPVPCALDNQPPVADAGINQTVESGSSVQLNGVASDSDGTIVSINWQQNAGPAVTLSSSTAALTSFVAPDVLADTVFSFQLNTQDDKGATASSTTNVTVKPKTNVLPVANAGLVQSVNEGSNVNLNGSGTDSDGSIVSYAWVQTAGPAVTLVNPNAAVASFVAPQVSADTVLGFRLTVLDNRGGSAVADTSVTVKDTPDLTVTALTTATLTVNRGSSFSLKVSTKNAGTKSSGVSSYTGVYLTTSPASVSTSNTRIGRASISSTLAAGSTSNATITVTVPSTMAVGTYYIGAIADYTKRVVEANEANNTLIGPTLIVK